MRIFPSFIAILTLLSACGGGNEGGGGGGGTPSANMPITSANAMQATRVSYEAALTSSSLGTLSSDTGVIAAGPENISKLGGGIAQSAGSGGQAAGVPIPPTTSPCDGGGDVTISGDIADVITFNLSPNDFFVVDFNMCNDGLGTTIDGGLDYVVDAFSGNFLGGLYDLTMTMTLDTLQVTTATDVISMTGGATARLDTLQSPAVSATTTGSALTVDANASTESLRDFASAQTVDPGAPQSPYTMTASGTLDSSQLSGVVQYSTPTMFAGFGADYPHNGVFLVTGNNSSARLTALDNVNILIEIDSDGDGSIDDTINTTWAEFESS